MKQIEIIKTALDKYLTHNNAHKHHMDEVNNTLHFYQTETNCTILNVSTFITPHNDIITTIYFDELTD